MLPGSRAETTVATAVVMPFRTGRPFSRPDDPDFDPVAGVVAGAPPGVASGALAPESAAAFPKYSRLPSLGGWLARTMASTSNSPSMRSTITSMRPLLSLRPKSRAWITFVSLNTTRLPGASSDGRSVSSRSATGCSVARRPVTLPPAVSLPAAALFVAVLPVVQSVVVCPVVAPPVAPLPAAAPSADTSSRRPPARCSGGYCAISSSGRW